MPIEKPTKKATFSSFLIQPKVGFSYFLFFLFLFIYLFLKKEILFIWIEFGIKLLKLLNLLKIDYLKGEKFWAQIMIVDSYPCFELTKLICMVPILFRDDNELNLKCAC